MDNQPASNSSANQRELKEKLPHAWDSLLARFGRFTEIQTLAITSLLDGNNCMLASATASGKTEAALAPLLELYLQRRKSSKNLSILYLTPTRALARDLMRRLGPPLEKMSMRIQVKTGDEPALNPHRPPELLLTTPESFDSLLTKTPRIFKDVRAVVIDELHIFDSTPRGDQLRILLNRLRRLKRYALSRGETDQADVQFCALSATISEPEATAARYFTEPVVIKVPGQRPIDSELIELPDAERLSQVFAGLKRKGRKKVLAFCVSRAECEQWAYQLRSGTPFGDRVYVHHASLSAAVRRSVEENFAHTEAALCFATSTLELGIDIGDVDLVVLIGAPSNTSAFLQRIGRGNRRASRTSVVCCYRNQLERALFQVFIRAAESGEDPDSEPYFFRPSVVVQQLCSYIKQTRLGEIDPESAYELFATPEGAPLIPKPAYDQIIDHLLIKQFFVTAQGRALRPGPAWQELYEQRAIYTNLLDLSRRTVEIIEAETGRKLGEVDRAFPPGESVLFGGRARRAIYTSGRRLIVRTAGDEGDALLPRLRAPWRPMSYGLAQAVAEEIGAPRAADRADLAMVIETEDQEDVDSETVSPETVIFHCAGDAWGLILGDLLENLHRVRVEDYNDLYLTLKGPLPAGPLEFSLDKVRIALRRRWRQMESWFDLGRFQNHLPLDARRASVIAAFDVEKFTQTFNGRKLSKATT